MGLAPEVSIVMRFHRIYHFLLQLKHRLEEGPEMRNFNFSGEQKKLHYIL